MNVQELNLILKKHFYESCFDVDDLNSAIAEEDRFVLEKASAFEQDGKYQFSSCVIYDTVDEKYYSIMCQRRPTRFQPTDYWFYITPEAVECTKVVETRSVTSYPILN